MPYVKRNTMEIGQRYRTTVGKETTLRVVDIQPPDKHNRYEQVVFLVETTGKTEYVDRKRAETLLLELVKED